MFIEYRSIRAGIHADLREQNDMIGSKILIVDDAVVFADNMSGLLRNRGYRTKAVNSGEAAISALKGNRFDVVVLDLRMSGMGGFSTLKEIKKGFLPTKVLILTGHGSLDINLNVLAMGADAYLTKPCDVVDLVTKIEDVLEKKGDADKYARTL
jgi:DNA-binding response OmpR family regulator